MAEIIHRKAAVADILADARATLVAATARGGNWKTLAEEQLQTPLALSDLIEGKLHALEAKLTSLEATLRSEDGSADALLAHDADDIWNLIGRPAEDPYYSLLFPAGIGFYVDGPDDEQPARMELLAELLEAKLHPRLEPARAQKIATDLRASAKTLQAAVSAVQVPRTQHEMYSRVRSALGRSCQIALSNLKRRYIVAGYSQTEIHTVIPGHTKAKPEAKPDKPAAPSAPKP